MDKQQLVGIIKNFREVNTRNGRSMAAFFIGCVPVKCFDENVTIAAHAAEAGDRVRLSGDFHDYHGQIEFATNSIAADAPVKSDVQSGLASDAPAKPAEPVEEAVVGKAPEDGGDTLTGVIRDIRNIHTKTGLKMVVFRVGTY